LVDGLHSPELAIVLVLLAQVNAVGAIFLTVPLMIVVAVPVIVPSVVITVVSRDRHGKN
jgi:hypothetical protein